MDDIDDLSDPEMFLSERTARSKNQQNRKVPYGNERAQDRKSNSRRDAEDFTVDNDDAIELPRRRWLII